MVQTTEDDTKKSEGVEPGWMERNPTMTIDVSLESEKARNMDGMVRDRMRMKEVLLVEPGENDVPVRRRRGGGRKRLMGHTMNQGTMKDFFCTIKSPLSQNLSEKREYTIIHIYTHTNNVNTLIYNTLTCKHINI